MQVWIECPQFHWIGVWMTQKLMHENVGKHVKDAKKQRKPNKEAQSKQGKHVNIA